MDRESSRPFDHERLDVYRKARSFRERVDDIVPALPPGKACVAEQIGRAALSIGLNIAEGAGEFSPKEKVRFYRIARRSATECSGLLDALGSYCEGRVGEIAQARHLLADVSTMLLRLIQSSERKGRNGRPGSR